MNNRTRTICVQIAVTLAVLVVFSPVNSDVEIRTLQAWNLPHPFQGPKSLTENVFAHLIHPTVREFAKEHNLSIQYSKEDDCLIIHGDADNLNVIKSSLAQLTSYRHPYSSLFLPEDADLAGKKVLRFSRVCAKDGNVNPLRGTLEFLSVVPEVWSKPVRYGLNYPTLGVNQFPETVIGGKEKEIKGEIVFLSKEKNRDNTHVLSYRGISKEDLRDKLRLGRDETRVYMDVPYKKLLTQVEDGSPQWALYRAGSKALKMLCPNYTNERVKQLFLDQEYRNILQKMADFIYHKRGVGITDTGLQPIHQSNVLEFNAWRPYSREMVEKTNRQLLNLWKAWLTSQTKNASAAFRDFFYIENDQLLDVKTGELVTVRLFFADTINDQPYFENLKAFLEQAGILELAINRRNDFVTVDRFRTILEGQESLKDGHEGIVFDIPVPYNDHIEHYFSMESNFFGLDASIAPKVTQQIQSMQSGDWAVNTTKRLGRLLREESPCVVIGQHPFYVYTRKSGNFGLPAIRETNDATTAFRLGNRIKHSAVN